MLVQSFLVQGTGAALAIALARFSSTPLDALVLFSLGAHHPTLLQAVSSFSSSRSTCPVVYMTETYGIIGFDEVLKQNVELMEKGRGSEYGYVGGSGGQGCLVTAFSGGAMAGHTANLPSAASTCMVIADSSGAWASQVRNKAPLHYGGITKECWRIENNDLHKVPYFWVADTDDSVGVSIFTENEDAGQAATALLAKVPSETIASGDFGLFPCFTRGVNQYGAENVETSQIVKAFPGARIFGMFAHGELGPTSSFSGFPSDSSSSIACTQHSMTSILSIHTMLE